MAAAQCGHVCETEEGRTPTRYCGAPWRNAVYANPSGAGANGGPLTAKEEALLSPPTGVGEGGAVSTKRAVPSHRRRSAGRTGGEGSATDKKEPHADTAGHGDGGKGGRSEERKAARKAERKVARKAARKAERKAARKAAPKGEPAHVDADKGEAHESDSKVLHGKQQQHG